MSLKEVNDPFFFINSEYTPILCAQLRGELLRRCDDQQQTCPHRRTLLQWQWKVTELQD